MSPSESTKGVPLTAFDTILVLMFVFVHVFVIGLVIELTRGKQTVEYDCELGWVHTNVDGPLCHEEAAALLAIPVGDDSSLAHAETVSDEPPAYCDVVGIDLTVFVVETDDTDDEEDGTW